MKKSSFARAAEAALIALALYPPQTLLLVFGLYALSGPVMAIMRRRGSGAEPA